MHSVHHWHRCTVWSALCVPQARCLPSKASTGATLTFHVAAGASEEHLPVAHTCSNRVDLPRYASQQQLADKLKQAIVISKASGGFQLG